MSQKHTPGRVCDACEGFCLEPVSSVSAGVELSLRIGQHVKHRDFNGRRVTGIVTGLSIDSEGSMKADIALDAPIVIAAGEGRPLDLWRQCVPAHELTPFDDRDELIDDLLHALQAEQEWRQRDTDGAIDPEWDYESMVGDLRRAAISKATGAAS